MLVGYDWASVDGDAPPDWKKATSLLSMPPGTRAAFAIIRACYGTWADPTFERDWDGIKAAGLTRGAYLFLRFPYKPGGFTADGQSPEEQVRAFAHTVGTHTDDDFVGTIDVEFPGNGLRDTGMTPLEAIAWVRRAHREFVQIYGVAPMLYDSARVWREDLNNPNATDLTDSPLWLAKPWPHAERTPADLSAEPFKGGKLDPQVPPEWGLKNWWLHQYQGDALGVPGFTKTVDISRFNPMSPNERSARVAWVQGRLGMPLSGVYDVTMASRVIAFQQQRGLVQDAIIGPKTFAQISWCAGIEQPETPRAA